MVSVYTCMYTDISRLWQAANGFGGHIDTCYDHFSYTSISAALAKIFSSADTRLYTGDAVTVHCYMVPMHDSNVVILHWYQCTTVHW